MLRQRLAAEEAEPDDAEQERRGSRSRSTGRRRPNATKVTTPTRAAGWPRVNFSVSSRWRPTTSRTTDRRDDQHADDERPQAGAGLAERPEPVAVGEARAGQADRDHDHAPTDLVGGPARGGRSSARSWATSASSSARMSRLVAGGGRWLVSLRSLVLGSSVVVHGWRVSWRRPGRCRTPRPGRRSAACPPRAARRPRRPRSPSG